MASRPPPPPKGESDLTPPLNELFRLLRDRWIAAAPGRHAQDLAPILGINRSRIYVWASGIDPGHRTPPWNVLLRLARAVGVAIVLEGNRAFLLPVDALPAASEVVHGPA